MGGAVECSFLQSGGHEVRGAPLEPKHGCVVQLPESEAHQELRHPNQAFWCPRPNERSHFDTPKLKSFTFRPYAFT